MQSLSEILFSSWIGILSIFVIVFIIGMGFFFRSWINKNIAAEEAEMSRNKSVDQSNS